MKKLLEDLGEKKFRLWAIFACALGDGVIFYWLYQRFTAPGMFKQMYKMALTSLPPGSPEIPGDLEKQLYILMINSLILMIALMVLLHWIIYAFYNKDKTFARQYMIALTWVAGPSCIILGATGISSNIILSILFMLQGIAYLFVARGIFHFKK